MSSTQVKFYKGNETEKVLPKEMKIEKIQFDSFRDFFHSVIIPTGDLNKKLSCEYIFRGEETNKYELIPSALRKNNTEKLRGLVEPVENQSEFEFWQIYAEYMLLREFYKIANSNGLKVPTVTEIKEYFVSKIPLERLYQRTKYKWIPTELVELAALAQHYGIPTRLIDWTFDPFVALYFASMGAIKSALNSGIQDNDKMVIWALNSQQIQSKQITVAKIPINFVVPSYNENPNLSAQKGVLTNWEIEMSSTLEELNNFSKNSSKIVDRIPLNELLKPYCRDDAENYFVGLYKFEFPVEDCVLVYNTIKQFGYSAARLFPGYSGVTQKIEEDRKAVELNNTF